ncbi:hypothetical protein [Actinomadura atramentaria]|uniref:hypothetical protein n=1 Tax=Actinomadura atramentaria TaxID=1990 RepID=UPI00039AF4D8|nr:hypothetical protein [Actinomadura atramentaria]
MRLRRSPRLPVARSAGEGRGRLLRHPVRAALGATRFAGWHLLAIIVLAGGIAVRTVAVLGYPGALWFGDSYHYLRDATQLTPGELRPSGYSLFLWLLRPLHSLTAVLAVQHALGILFGVMVYALVWRAGRAAWPLTDGSGLLGWRHWLPGLVGAVLITPIVLPTHEISLEHGLFAETFFTFLLLTAFLMVLWKRRMPWWVGALAGLLIGASAVTRTLGLPFIALLLLGMLVRRAGWRAMVAATVAFAAPVVGYMFWFQSVWGDFATSKASGIFLYGRVAEFADCAVIKPDARLAALCPKHTDPRISAAYSVMWAHDSPFRGMPDAQTNKENNELASEFAREAILAQPGDYIRVVVNDTLRCFKWERTFYPNPWTQRSYVFPVGERWPDSQRVLAEQYTGNDSGESRVVQPWSGRMLRYQAHIWMPGTILGAIFLAALVVPLFRMRIPGRRRNRRALLDWIQGPMIPWGVGLGLLVVPAATADFDYRYVLPAVPFACLALGLALLTPKRSEAAIAEARPAAAESAEHAGDAEAAVIGEAVETIEPAKTVTAVKSDATTSATEPAEEADFGETAEPAGTPEAADH